MDERRESVSVSCLLVVEIFSPFICLSSISTAILAILATSCLTLVIPVPHMSAIIQSSKPASFTCSGTFIPYSLKARYAPAANVSVVAIMPSKDNFFWMIDVIEALPAYIETFSVF